MSASEVSNTGGMTSRPRNRWRRQGLSPVTPPPQPAVLTAHSGRKVRAVRKGKELDAERWRASLIAGLQHESDPESLHAVLASGIEIEAWRMLLDGSKEPKLRFRTFRQFCLAPQPHGLETPHEEVEAFLRSLLGRRKADLLTVPEPQQGARTDLGATSCPGGTMSKRHEKRKRAVNRAPEAIRRLCELGIISYKAAEFCGVESPQPDRRIDIERFTETAKGILSELGDAPSTEAVKRARIEAKARIPAPDPVAKLVRQVEQLAEDEQERILRLLRPPKPEESAGGSTDQLHTVRIELPPLLHERVREAAALLRVEVSALFYEGIVLALRHHDMGADLPPPRATTPARAAYGERPDQVPASNGAT